VCSSPFVAASLSSVHFLSTMQFCMFVVSASVLWGWLLLQCLSCNSFLTNGSYQLILFQISSRQSFWWWLVLHRWIILLVTSFLVDDFSMMTFVGYDWLALLFVSAALVKLRLHPRCTNLISVLETVLRLSFMFKYFGSLILVWGFQMWFWEGHVFLIMKFPLSG
jgi:hypothetical protein